jgi:3-methyladenine DNA glycosylase/8-oxoguanine DNA glycosylase
MSNQPVPDPATLAKMEEEFAHAEGIYRQKLNQLVAAARAILAANPAGAGLKKPGGTL